MLEMIEIKMRITQRMDEIARLVAGHLRHHLREQRIRCDIEWHTKKNIGRALIQLARQLSFRDIKLEKGSGREAKPCCRPQRGSTQ